MFYCSLLLCGVWGVPPRHTTVLRCFSCVIFVIAMEIISLSAQCWWPLSISFSTSCDTGPDSQMISGLRSNYILMIASEDMPCVADCSLSAGHGLHRQPKMGSKAALSFAARFGRKSAPLATKSAKICPNRPKLAPIRYLASPG